VHQFVTWKGSAERSDSEMISLGGVEEIDASLFFDFDYAALGHLHGPQRMGKDTVRYAGSPMPYSFSEIRQKKGITVVELKEKGEVTIDLIPLETKRKYREIKGPLQALIDIAKEEKSEDYIRCILTDDEALLDPIGQLRSVYPNLMTLEFTQKSRTDDQEIIVDTEDIRPDELFALFYEKQNERELDEIQKELLDHIWKEVEGAE
jgi:exonuclease SbcD